MPAPDDPFDLLLRPSPEETPSERQDRLDKEAEAKRVSLAIDATLRAEKVARRKKRIVRLLLLGQSESGKSTTLRQFQRIYTPTSFREERILWRAVIQLNIVRSVHTILDAISYSSPLSSPRTRPRSVSRSHQPPIPSSSSSPPHVYQPQYYPPQISNNNTIASFTLPSPPTYPPPLPPNRSSPPAELYPNDEDNSDSEYANIHYHHHAFPATHQNQSPNSSPKSHLSNPTHSSFTLAHSSSSIPLQSTSSSPSPLEALRTRLLGPLQHIETLLVSKILQQEDSSTTHFSVSSPGALDSPEHAGRSLSIFGDEHVQGQNSPTGSYFAHPQCSNHNTNFNNPNSQYYNQELSVRFGPGWRGVLSNARVDSVSPASPSTRSPSSDKNKKDEAREILYSLRKDIIQLWNDPAVRDILRKKKIKLEERSGFFLDDIERVTSLRFLPSDVDVLKARLKTVGVSEYKFEIELGAGRHTGTEWRIIDVGGSRSQRPTWVPFFDDVDAIIFLAPISAFDQVLSEDRTINRLEDSVLLWKAVCSSKLLAGVDLILFLNKCDILDKKLKSGVRMSKYVRNYAGRPNDLDSVCKYLRGKFSAIHREYSPNPRKFYAFCTSVTDTSTTSGIIASVRDMVIRQHLKSSKLL